MSEELQRVGATIEHSDTASKSISVRFDPNTVTRADLESALEAIGFPTAPEAIGFPAAEDDHQ